jgi:hypothetical protein
MSSITSRPARGNTSGSWMPSSRIRRAHDIGRLGVRSGASRPTIGLLDAAPSLRAGADSYSAGGSSLGRRLVPVAR